MKKTLIALMLCFVSIWSIGQEINILSNKFPIYQGVVTNNLPAITLYSQTKLWIADAFKSAQNVIQYDNEREATILVKGNTHIGSGIREVIAYFTLKIEGRDNRFRYTLEITDITGAYGSGLTQSVMAIYLKNEKYGNWVTEEISPQLNHWINSILNTQTNSSSDDW